MSPCCPVCDMERMQFGSLEAFAHGVACASARAVARTPRLGSEQDRYSLTLAGVVGSCCEKHRQPLFDTIMKVAAAISDHDTSEPQNDTKEPAE